MDVAHEASRHVKVRPAAGAAPALEVLELSDLLALILRLAASPDALVTKRIARAGRAVAPVVRKIIWTDRILKGTAILKRHTDRATCCALSPDGNRIATASYDKTARLWDAETGALLTTLEGHTGKDNCCVFSPDSKRVVTASDDKTARLWDAETGVLQTTLEGRTKFIYSCACSHDGKRLMTASSDKTARLWNAAL